MSNFFTQILEDWYIQNHRELPWRDTQDPYRIWISEIILQQTRVTQGYDYYLRFLKRFPDVSTLAYASEDEVLLMWQGLGYYSRARNLHKAAKTIVELGHFPTDYEGILRLPGIGDYTASAIASFAYGLPHAVVDGNVYRVISRYFGIDTPIDSTEGKKVFRALANEMLDVKNPALYNQSIMDFGALVCTPHANCSFCPLLESCTAYHAGKVGDWPIKSHKTKVRPRHLIYLFIRTNGKVLIHRRPAGDIWQGLYEPFLVELTNEQSISFQRKLRSNFPKAIKKATGVKHQLSHQALTADLYLLDCLDSKQTEETLASLFGQEYDQGSYFWAEESSLDEYAAPRLILELYKNIQ